MELPPGLRLSFENEPSWQDREIVDEALGEYNAPFLRDPSYTYFGLFVRDEAGIIKAGLIGNTYAGWLFVNLLWVHATLRRGAVGSGLMAAAETHAIAQNCHSSWVDTFSWQAPGFYRKLGYQEFGRLALPPNHERIFFKKQLTAEAE